MKTVLGTTLAVLMLIGCKTGGSSQTYDGSDSPPKTNYNFHLTGQTPAEEPCYFKVIEANYDVEFGWHPVGDPVSTTASYKFRRIATDHQPDGTTGTLYIGSNTTHKFELGISRPWSDGPITSATMTIKGPPLGETSRFCDQLTIVKP